MFQTRAFLYSRTSLHRCNKKGINNRFCPLLVSPGEWSYANREPNSYKYNHFGAFYVRYFARVCQIFYSRGKRVATWSSRCALKSLCRHAYCIGAVCLFFRNTDKKNTDVILIKSVDHVLCQIFQLWRFRLVCMLQLIILFMPAK